MDACVEYKPCPGFATKLDALRRREKMTRRALSAAIGGDESAVSKMVAGKREPTSGELQRLVEYFGKRGGVLLAKDTAKQRQAQQVPLEEHKEPPTSADTPHWMRMLRETQGLTLDEMAQRCDAKHGRLGIGGREGKDGVVCQAGRWRCSARLLEILESGGVTTEAWARTIAKAYGMTTEQRVAITAERSAIAYESREGVTL